MMFKPAPCGSVAPALLWLIPLMLPAQDAFWGVPSHPSVRLTALNPQQSQLNSTVDAPYSVLANQAAPVTPGSAFELSLTIELDPATRALPELACFDRSGAEIPAPNLLDKAARQMTTRPQTIRRVLMPCPGAATVRPRLRAEGKGRILLKDLSLKTSTVDTYVTGMLVSPPHPKLRHGLVLEANHGIVNRRLVSYNDRDDDGLWAVVEVDLDELSRVVAPASDWRSGFADNPNEILWSDGSVLKSDTIREEREPSRSSALQWRMTVRPGPYRVYVSDPGRAVSVSVNGLDFRRFPGGKEIDLGVQQMADGNLELWLDACHLDPVSVGPAYFDYVRLMPVAESARGVALANAALEKKPSRLAKTTVDERRVAVALDRAAPAGWPVRASIPIRAGELADPQQSAVLTLDGKPIASQVKALATWPDGSVKWLHADFASTGAERYFVAYGTAVPVRRPAAAIKLEETGSGVAVDTGALRFQMPRGRFAVVEQNGKPLQIEVTETSGKVWRALDLPALKMDVEQRGPYHAIIRAESWMPDSGKPAGGFYHRVRVHAYAGSSLLHIDHFVVNVDSRSKVDTRSISLRLPAAASAKPPQINPAGSNVPGWITTPNLSVGVENFRELFPKAIRTRAGEIQVDLWAPEGGTYEWFPGVGKTHRLAVLFGAPPKEAALLANGPFIAFPTQPASMAPTQAFGALITAAESPSPAIEQTLARHMADPVVAGMAFGFENHGDHSSAGYVKGAIAWDNNEYDLPAAAFVHYARTGDRAALRAGLAAALHYADVDTIHYHPKNAEYRGGAWTHSHGTFGHHTAEPPGMSHAGYTQGLILYSYLTGHPEGLEAARDIADWCLRNIRPERNLNAMERALGHPLMSLTDVYEATGEERYLRGAAKLVDWALQWEHPARGGHLNSITEKPAYYSGSPFCSGLLTAGLMKFNEWAKDPAVDAMLERTARWVLTDMWRPEGIFNKGGGTPVPQNIGTHARLLRMMYQKTKDPFYLAVPAELLMRGYGANAKPFGTRTTGLVFNYVPWFLTLLNEEGHPEADSAVQIAAENVTVRPGYKTEVTFTIRNSGSDVITAITSSFNIRPDFVQLTEPKAPEGLLPGQVRQLTFLIDTPTDINLTHKLNTDAYAHWTIRHTRAGRPRFAHGFAKVQLVP